MVVVKIIIRILLLPVRICLTLIQLMLMFSTWLSATVFHVLSGIICITAGELFYRLDLKDGIKLKKLVKETV